MWIKSRNKQRRIAWSYKCEITAHIKYGTWKLKKSDNNQNLVDYKIVFKKQGLTKQFTSQKGPSCRKNFYLKTWYRLQWNVCFCCDNELNEIAISYGCTESPETKSVPLYYSLFKWWFRRRNDDENTKLLISSKVFPWKEKKKCLKQFTLMI